jgi:hypothetical protein
MSVPQKVPVAFPAAPTSFSALPGYLDAHVKLLNGSRVFAGLMIVVLNVASKFTTLKLSKTMEAYLKHTFSRDALAFAIAWMGSRDIYAAIVIVIVFKLVADHLMNEESRFCILSDHFCNHHMALAAKTTEPFDGAAGKLDADVSPEEVRAALDVLNRAFRRTQHTPQSANIGSATISGQAL